MVIEFTIDGQTGYVDDIDADLLNIAWQARKKNIDNSYYLVATIKSKNVRLHRMIMERVLGRPLEKGGLVDHRDRNGLNNTRENLRTATHQQNMANRSVGKNNKLGVKGVHKQRGRYLAQIDVNRKRVYLGSFATLEEARNAYCAAAKKYNGEFACGV